MACPSSTCRPSPDQLNLLRHPRSFAFGGEMWRHQRLAASRRKRVAFGQRLYNVNEAMEQDDDDDVSNEAPPRGLAASASAPGLLQGGPGPSRGAARRGVARRRAAAAPVASARGGGSGIGALQFRGAFEATDAAGDFDESLVTNDAVTVKNSSDAKVDGTVVASPCADIEARDVALLKMIEMEDPGSYKGVRFGDDVAPDLRRHGRAVVEERLRRRRQGPHGDEAADRAPGPDAGQVPRGGRRAREPREPRLARRLPGAGGDPGSPTPNSHASVKLGAPTPVRATLPKGKDDAAWSFHEMRMRNVAALTLGRWRIMPATEELAKAATKRGGYVCNFDHVYLEQDFFYMCHDATAAPLTFHRTPAEGESTAGYKVERRGIWKLRVAEASTNLREMSKGEQRSEMLMDARKCLALSDANRYGRRRYRSDTGEVERPGAVTTTSKIRFPPPSQRKRPAAAFDADAAAAAKARDHDGATVVSQLTADTHDEVDAPPLHGRPVRGPVVDRLEGEDVFLAHNIDYLKRRHRFKTMFAKLQIDSSADQVIYGKKAKAKDGASRDLLEDPPADMAVFEEEESLGAFMGDGALLKEMTLSTLGLLRDSVANNLNAAVQKRTEEAELARVACEAAVLVVTFSEMVVAPRMRFVAVRLRDHLFGAANMAPDDASDSAAPPSPLKAARRPALFSTSFLSLVSATLGGPSVDEFGVGARVWVAHADGSATSATVLAAPQPRSGRCRSTSTLAVGEDSIWADAHALNGIEVHRPELEKLFVKAAADKKDAPSAEGRQSQGDGAPPC
ncbi:hypothetical protein JL722_13042 [Aureococcus anophagefferens]|nr:hypothetical protein JL722_13042 [Aureococcus anophagefferens]